MASTLFSPTPTRDQVKENSIRDVILWEHSPCSHKFLPVFPKVVDSWHSRSNKRVIRLHRIEAYSVTSANGISRTARISWSWHPQPFGSAHSLIRATRPAAFLSRRRALLNVSTAIRGI